MCAFVLALKACAKSASKRLLPMAIISGVGKKGPQKPAKSTAVHIKRKQEIGNCKKYKDDPKMKKVLSAYTNRSMRKA